MDIPLPTADVLAGDADISLLRGVKAGWGVQYLEFSFLTCLESHGVDCRFKYFWVAVVDGECDCVLRRVLQFQRNWFLNTQWRTNSVYPSHWPLLAK